MSTFSGLNAAASGLNAARQGLDVVGQNMTNATTNGYTRQRVTTSAIGSLARVGLFSGGSVGVGQGVSIDGIARLGDQYLDAQVRSTAATSGNLAVRSNALTAVQAALNEPGDDGLSTQLQGFWGAWGDVSNRPGDVAAGGVLLQKATALTDQIAAGYSAVNDQWGQVRTKLDGMVQELNDAGSQVADLNAQIRSTLAAGGSANELLDKRSVLLGSISALTGASVQTNQDGTVDVLVGGNQLVSGDRSYAVAVSGSSTMTGTPPVTLEWATRPGLPVAVESGEIAGSLAMLAPANATGTGGEIAEAAAGFNSFATYLANQVNAVHRTGATSTGATDLDFFAISSTGPAALGLTVVPTDTTGIAVAGSGEGALGNTTADAIAQLGTAADSPDSMWSSFVVKIGVSAKSALQRASLADSAASAASDAQVANASVDIDEENISMVTFQTAYQGAARLMTAVDEMLDVLINHTGLVGR
ncbi:MAG TPA: flagellar hook-associated protein FlgK [Lacisediminihabitans sp.]|uniref:flagellar hook-associated protein FlgK n=1 Tax=Lacisediminihabitans sp. TaxID=2787631 RepID=UPI002ED9E778